MSAAPQAAAAGDAGLRRAFEALADHASRALSNRAQAPLRVQLEAFGTAGLGVLSDLSGPFDRTVSLRLAAERTATLLVSRPLAYAFLALRFGGRGPGAALPLPERCYTAIEEEGLVRTALELYRALAEASDGALPPTPRAAALVPRGDLRAAMERPVLLAAFVTEGLPGEARFWIALDPDPAQGGKDHEDPTSGALAAPFRNTAAQGPSVRKAQGPAAPLSLRGGSRVTVELGGPRGAALRVDGRLLAEGRAHLADDRLVFEVAADDGDGDAPL